MDQKTTEDLATRDTDPAPPPSTLPTGATPPVGSSAGRMPDGTRVKPNGRRALRAELASGWQRYDAPARFRPGKMVGKTRKRTRGGWAPDTVSVGTMRARAAVDRLRDKENPRETGHKMAIAAMRAMPPYVPRNVREEDLAEVAGLLNLAGGETREVTIDPRKVIDDFRMQKNARKRARRRRRAQAGG